MTRLSLHEASFQQTVNFPDDDLPSDAPEIHQRIWRIIREHRGYRNAIPQRTVARTAGLEERSVRAIAVELIETYGKAIGSSCDAKHGGYFVVMNEADRDIAARELKARIASSARRLKILDEISYKSIFKDQPELFGEPPPVKTWPTNGMSCWACRTLTEAMNNPHARCAMHK